ncbi:MAG: hypothetical protein L3J28_02550 [Candidatus Polarisedimenticolaceae bacterium]|nr:hypothetical protein [Candidatus Polarisedimenticolaceae bacterium]
MPALSDDAETSPFSDFDVPEKRARLPDEKTVNIKRFVVKRLIPKAEVEGECVDEFCAVPLENPDLELLLGTLLTQYENQFTIFDLEDVATRVTQFFRQRELILDAAFLPPQTVKDQTVFIHVLQGRLGKITTKGNERYFDYTLLTPFRGMVGRTVRRDEITQALLNVWDYPGLRFAERKAQLTFLPGEQTGLTNLELDVSEEKYPFNIALSADNSGSDYSGVYRTRIDIDLNDPTDAADQLSVAWMNNFNPDNSDFYSISYERPVFSSDLKFGIGHSGNQFVLGQELKELEIDGFSEQSYLSLGWIAKQTFRERLMLGSRLNVKEAVTRQAGETVAIDRLTVLDLNAGGLFSDEWLLASSGSSQTLFVATYSHGFGDLLGSMEARDDPDSSRQGEEGEQAGAEFDKLVVELSRRQRFFWGTLLSLRLNGQYSDDLLVSLEQMSLGGPDSVRAYPTAEVLRDSGYFVSADWIFTLPFLTDEMVPKWLSAGRQVSWEQALSFSLFVDHAAGQRNNPLGNEEEFAELSGAGFGLNFETPALMVKMTLAKPLGDVEPSNEEDPQFFMSMQWKLF